MIRRIEDVAAYFANPVPAKDRSSFRYCYPLDVPEAAGWLGTVLHSNYLDSLAGLLSQLNPATYGVIGGLLGTLESYWLQQYPSPALQSIVVCDLDIAAYHPRRENGSYVYRNICSLDHGAFQGEFVFLRADSTQTTRIGALGPYDVFFVDGRHDRMAVCEDMLTAFKSLRTGGFMLVHDIDMEGSSVREGYDAWVHEMGDLVQTYEVPHPQFHLGLGVVQKISVDVFIELHRRKLTKLWR